MEVTCAETNTTTRVGANVITVSVCMLKLQASPQFVQLEAIEAIMLILYRILSI